MVREIQLKLGVSPPAAHASPVCYGDLNLLYRKEEAAN